MAHGAASRRGHLLGTEPRGWNYRCSPGERVKVVMQHFENLLRFRGERVALNMIRQRISKYSPYLQPWPHLRQEVRFIEDVNAFRDYMAKGVETIEADESQLAS